MNKLNILKENNDLFDVKKFSLYLKLLKLKEKETYLHSIRVSNYSTRLAKKLGFNEEMVSVIWLSALLHDIGKLMIPNYILLGKNKLSEDDYLLIREHPLDSLIFLQEFTSERVFRGAVEHHERLDGNGYPYGIKDISIVGRIIAISDTFDAMTSNRTYQNPLTYNEALDKMNNFANLNLYDNDILNCFKEVVLEIKNDNRCN